MASKDTAGSSGGGGTSLTTASIAVAANSNRVLYFGITLGASARSVTSVVRDGQSATLVSRVTRDSTVAEEVWRIIAPNTGSATALASFDGSVAEVVVGWYSAYNVNQTTPNTTPVTKSQVWTTETLSITSGSTDDIVLGFLGWNRGGTANASFGSGQASEFNDTTTHWMGGCLTSKPGTGGADTLEISTSSAVDAAGIGFALTHEAPPAGPTLTSPTTTGITATGATIGCTTDTASGNRQSIVTTSATPPSTSGGLFAAGTYAYDSGPVAVSATGAFTSNATGLTPSTAYYSHHIHNGSNVVTAGPFTTAPACSAATGAATGINTALVGATVTGSAGTLYAVVSAAQPSNAQIKAGQDSTGAAAPAGTHSITSPGAKTIAVGASPAVAAGSRTVWLLATNAAGTADGNVVSASWTQPANLSITNPSNQTGVSGSAFSWSGSTPAALTAGGVGTKSYTCTGLGSSGLTMNSSTGVLSGTCGTAGTYNIAGTVTDQSTAGTPNPQTQSFSFTLTISAAGIPPTVATNPTNLTVTDGGTASFVGSFNGSPAPSLQWQEFLTGPGWTAMSGETAQTLNLGTVDLTDNGRQFRLGGTNAYGGPIYTASATLTVTAASVGTITSDVLAGWGDDTPVASTTIPFVAVERISDGVEVLALTNQVTTTGGRLVITNAAIVPTVPYMLKIRNADGTVRGYKRYVATS